jgi:hypothetical protein
MPSSIPATDAIQPDNVPVKLQVGPFIGTFPIGSFKPPGDRSYTLVGVINGAQLHAAIERTGVRRYLPNNHFAYPSAVQIMVA